MLEIVLDIAKTAKQTVELLEKNNLKISTAESCTGGMVCQYITSISGSSSVIDLGIISYANHIKENELGVLHTTLVEYGAVSSQVCHEMANGIVKKANSDIGIAVTGIAGPTGGTPEKPVGTVHIAVASKTDIMHKKLSLKGDREQIREQTTLEVFMLIQDFIRANIKLK